MRTLGAEMDQEAGTALIKYVLLIKPKPWVLKDADRARIEAAL